MYAKILVEMSGNASHIRNFQHRMTILNRSEYWFWKLKSWNLMVGSDGRYAFDGRDWWCKSCIWWAWVMQMSQGLRLTCIFAQCILRRNWNQFFMKSTKHKTVSKFAFLVATRHLTWLQKIAPQQNSKRGQTSLFDEFWASVIKSWRSRCRAEMIFHPK